MKGLKLTIAGLALLAFAFTPAGDTELTIGAQAPKADMKMDATSGTAVSLNDLKGEKGLLVVFSCNTCPFVVGAPGYGTGWDNRYNELYDLAEANDIGMVLVNSNAAKRKGADSMDAMIKKAKKSGYKSTYVVDEGSALADAFGANKTPHVYLFDGDMNLAYTGAIDDNNEDMSAVKEPYLKNALTQLGEGTPANISPNSTRAMGCSIKRVR